MPIDLDASPTRRSGPVQRPGDFLRAWEDGPPLVTNPSGGPRAGLERYGRASGAVSIIEDRTNLEKWTQRQLVHGIGLDPHLVVPLCVRLLDHERDSTEWREAADGAVVAALRLAKTSLAADRGTHVHALTEDDDTGADWMARAERGKDLGIGTQAQAAIVDAWRRMLDHHGFEVVATEAHVVHDGWRLAGTLDRIVRLTRPFAFGDVTLDAGEHVVLDIKSGQLKVDDGYWHGYAAQIAAYRDGVPYDVDEGTRGSWPFTMHERWALIAHVPVADVIAGGEAVISLVPVDLDAGRHAAELARRAKEWWARKDVFGGVLPSVKIVPSSPVGQPADPFDGLNGEPVRADADPAAHAWAATTREELRHDLAALDERAAAMMRARLAADGLPRLADCTPGQLAAVERHLADVLRDTGKPFHSSEVPATTPASAPRAAQEPRNVWQRPDDGGPLDEATEAAFVRSMKALPGDVAAWCEARLGESVKAGRPIKVPAGRTVRLMEVCRAMIACAALDDPDGELVRHLLAAVLSSEMPLMPACSLGQAFGSLAIDEARTLERAASAAVDGAAVLAFDGDGRPVLAVAA